MNAFNLNDNEPFIVLASRVVDDKVNPSDWMSASRALYKKATSAVFSSFFRYINNKKVYPASIKLDNGMYALVLFFGTNADEANRVADESGFKEIVKSPAFENVNLAITRAMNESQIYGMIRENSLDLPLINNA